VVGVVKAVHLVQVALVEQQLRVLELLRTVAEAAVRHRLMISSLVVEVAVPRVRREMVKQAVMLVQE
jgi:hypothetical protein